MNVLKVFFLFLVVEELIIRILYISQSCLPGPQKGKDPLEMDVIIELSISTSI